MKLLELACNLCDGYNVKLIGDVRGKVLKTLTTEKIPQSPFKHLDVHGFCPSMEFSTDIIRPALEVWVSETEYREAQGK